MRLQIIAMLCGAALLPFAARAQQPPTSLFCNSIGVKVGPMTPAVADSLGMTERYGAVFRRPRSGGPAAKAGIEAFDVVTAINGAPLKSWSDFATMISAMAPGATVSLTTYRNRQLIEVRVRLGWSKCASGSGKRADRGFGGNRGHASMPQGTRSALD
jgi:predicted metalloprotease with PDZ domain